MHVTSHSDPGAFAQLAVPLLMQNEAMNCLGLGIVDTLLNEPQRYPRFHLFAIESSAGIEGVAWMTPPYPLGLSPMSRAAVSALVEYVAGLDSGVPSVVGPKPTVDEFKTQWLSRRLGELQDTIEQRIYQVDRVTPAGPVPGAMRVASEAERALVEAWSLGFVRDCGLTDSPEVVRAGVTASLAVGSRVLWVREGEPVAMAGYSGRTPSGIRVNWVYTPPDKRRQGYASALVAALSQHLLDEGRRFCFLCTDLANPTSNGIYQSIGYKVVCEAAHHRFRA